VSDNSKTFATTFAIATASADTVAVDEYLVFDDDFRTFTENAVKYCSMNLSDYGLGFIIVEADQVIEIGEDGGAVIADCNGKTHFVVFTMTVPMQEKDLIKR
jgi:hypothetical protein